MPAIVEMARRHGATAAQITLRWITQQDVAAIAMSTKPANLAGNLQASALSLPAEDMAALTALGTEAGRLIDPAQWAPDWTA